MLKLNNRERKQEVDTDLNVWDEVDTTKSEKQISHHLMPSRAILPTKIINTHLLYSLCRAEALEMAEMDEQKRYRVQWAVSARRVARASKIEKWKICMWFRPRNPSEPLPKDSTIPIESSKRTLQENIQVRRKATTINNIAHKLNNKYT